MLERTFVSKLNGRLGRFRQNGTKKTNHYPRAGKKGQEQAKRVSNGLSGELKFWIFQEVIKEDDEFTHEGDEGEFLGFAVGEMGAIRWGQSADCNVRGARSPRTAAG